MAVGGAEEHFAKKLAHNDKKIRDRAVKRLQAWIASRKEAVSGFDEVDLLKIWKGLFYCFWMSDKPLVQEELAGNISKLIHSFKNQDSAISFLTAFFKTMHREWHGIDRLRMDKFYMLIRMMLKETFVMLVNKNWHENLCGRVCAVLVEGPVHPTNDKVPDGMRLHLISIYLQELQGATTCEIPESITLKLVEPFFNLAAFTKNIIVANAVKNGIFETLLQMKESCTNEEEEEEHHPLKVIYNDIVDRLFALASDRQVLGRNRNILYQYVKKFKKYASENVKANEDVKLGTKRKLQPETATFTTTEKDEADTEQGRLKKKKKKKKINTVGDDDETGNNRSEKGEIISKEKTNDYGTHSMNGDEVKNAGSDELILQNDNSGSLSSKEISGEPCVSKKKKIELPVDVEAADTPVKKKKNKAKHRKGSISSANESSQEQVIVNGSLTEHTSEPSACNSEVDAALKKIRQKIDAQQSGATASGATKTLETTSKKKPQNKSPFAAFEKAKTPPAYVKKRRPQTEPRKGNPNKEVPECPGSEPQESNKRVRIALSKNTSHTHQDYAKSLQESPTVPFSAERSPAFGLLKARSQAAVHRKTHSKGQKMKKDTRKRAKASDFF